MDIEVYANLSLAKIMKDMAVYAAIARRHAWTAAIGRHKIDVACDRMAAARNKCNLWRMQRTNRQLSLWRARHRTCK